MYSFKSASSPDWTAEATDGVGEEGDGGRGGPGIGNGVGGKPDGSKLLRIFSLATHRVYAMWFVHVRVWMLGEGKFTGPPLEGGESQGVGTASQRWTASSPLSISLCTIKSEEGVEHQLTPPPPYKPPGASKIRFVWSAEGGV